MQLFLILGTSLWVVFAQSGEIFSSVKIIEFLGFDCNANAISVQTGSCYRQTYSLVGNGTNCTNQLTWTNGSYPYFFLEMLNGGGGDAVTVTWGQNSRSLDSTGRLSIQPFLVTDQLIVTISIATGASSTLKGAYSLCPRETGTDPETTNVVIGYGGQGLVIQKFTPSLGATNWQAPHIWQITGQKQVALIAAAYEAPSFCTWCLENIYFYEGIGANADFMGTGTTISNSLFASRNNTVTVILVDDGDHSDYMAVAVNEYQNYEDCATSRAYFYSTVAPFPTIPVQENSCVTVFNQCYEQGVCDMPLLTDATYTGDPNVFNFFVYAGLAVPDAFTRSILWHIGIAYLSDPNMRQYQLPQQLAGNARTFQLFNNTGTFSLGQGLCRYQYRNPDSSAPTPGFYKAFTYRRGPLSSNQYPFFSTEQQRGNHIIFDAAPYDYQISITVSACYNNDSSIVIRTNEQSSTYPTITNADVGTVIVADVAASSSCEIEVFGGSTASYGTQFFFDITAQDGVVRTTTTTTTTTTMTTTAAPTTASTTGVTTPSTTTLKGVLTVSIVQSLMFFVVLLLFV